MDHSPRSCISLNRSPSLHVYLVTERTLPGRFILPYQEVIHMRVGREFAPLRSVLISFGIISISLLLIVTGCGSPTEGEYSLRGEWEGYIGFTMSIPPLIKGDLILDIDADRVCTCNGSLNGYYEGWGDFTIEFSGSPTINADRHLDGTISIIRYRAGQDTVVAGARIWGDFSELTPAAFGEWITVAGSPFSAGGRWGAEKK